MGWLADRDGRSSHVELVVSELSGRVAAGGTRYAKRIRRQLSTKAGSQNGRAIPALGVPLSVTEGGLSKREPDC
jgi:hypothetical protein